MAWRLHENVVRGEIDNRTRGEVRGRVWLAGIDAPLALELRGDCHPDLAGCVLTFQNPKPLAMETRPPALRQRGTAGDITAARKVRVFDIPFEEAYAMINAGGTPPEHMANALYLEWYSDLSGRVVIESADYVLEVSEPAWRFTAEELAERERQDEERGGAFIEEGWSEEGPWDEFRHEQMLREGDAGTERLGQLMEKYADHPDRDAIIEHEMGWDEDDGSTDEEAAAEIARMNEICAEAANEPEPEPDPAREGIDWVRGEDGRPTHPLVRRAQELTYGLFRDFDAAGLRDTGDEALRSLHDNTMTLGPKLAGALQVYARAGHRPEPGFTIALLKRALEYLHAALAGADASASARPALLPADRIAHYRRELFAIREDVIALIARLRGA